MFYWLRPWQRDTRSGLRHAFWYVPATTNNRWILWKQCRIIEGPATAISEAKIDSAVASNNFCGDRKNLVLGE
jgi:hypothetical protein